MNMNAKINPEGSVGEFLRQQREKEQLEKARKKANRPSSAIGITGRSLKSAKSVTDFFRDYDYYDVVQEIIDGNNEASQDINNTLGSGNRSISDKINDFMDNQRNYKHLIESTKEAIRNHEQEAIIEEDEYGDSPQRNANKVPHLQENMYDMATIESNSNFA
mmetsp:Transcript_4975/g.4179  ORF Transcript_4975/g.4179 Transcript_4975/m.4179 type:complete len:162 (+) Transcript_4975:622-1107(+)